MLSDLFLRQMIVGIKARWNGLFDNIMGLSDNIELHQELSDITRDYNRQVRELRKHDKVFHIHAPFRLENKEPIDFQEHYSIFEKCVRLGDKVNKSNYNLICHCTCNKGFIDAKKIIENVNKLLDKSSKAVLCFENLANKEHKFRDIASFEKINKVFENKQTGICLDVCHSHLVGPETFDSFINTYKEKIRQVHFADVGANGEHGVQIGTGIVDYNHVIKKVKELNKNTVLIPEVTGGHFENHKGMIIAYNFLKKNF